MVDLGHGFSQNHPHVLDGTEPLRVAAADLKQRKEFEATTTHIKNQSKAIIPEPPQE